MNAVASDGLRPLVLSLLASLVFVAGALYAGKRHLDAELAQRPRIVFVDELRAVRDAAPEGSPRDTAERTVARVEAAAEALAAEGYLVLTRDAVYAAPPGFEAVP
jgi:hypothetical protein